MVFDYSYLSYLSSHNAAWRLLQSPHAPLIIGFLRRVYLEPVVRQVSASTLAILLGDELYIIDQLSSEANFPEQASEYLNDWAERDWLRKFYTPNSDEPCFDVTPAAESAVRWACALGERTFIGTESRLLTFVALLKQMSEGSDKDAERRLAVLRKQRDEIDEQIAKVTRGEIDLLSENELRDRFQQVTQLSHDLLSTETKFEEVKKLLDRLRGRQGFTELDRRWRDTVIDVRQWVQFAASERWREDEREYEHYSNSGGKSGGQKEKLAYTVLAASLAYQFKLDGFVDRSKSFRVVVIDEAFGRGSDESAEYGLELFRKLNLQLLIVTPLQKTQIIEPFVSSVGFVENRTGKSKVASNRRSRRRPSSSASRSIRRLRCGHSTPLPLARTTSPGIFERSIDVPSRESLQKLDMSAYAGSTTICVA